MKTRPILFSAPMVRAILEGNKTMTRRVVKPQPLGDGPLYWPANKYKGDFLRDGDCPYGIAGDLLWVRETWTLGDGCSGDSLDDDDSWAEIYYRADGEHCLPVRHPVSAETARKHIDKLEFLEAFGDGKSNWRPSIHMPRWASRITLEITGVRVERLQEISRADAKAEGFWPSPHNGLESWNGRSYGNAELAFRACWDSINSKKYPWASNPWVWVIEFRKKQGGAL